MIKQLYNVANKFGLKYIAQASADGFDGEHIILHMFLYTGKNLYGQLSMPMITFIEVDDWFYIMNGIDTVFSKNEVVDQIRLWCKLYGIVELEEDESD
jgi:hypothetical protein